MATPGKGPDLSDFPELSRLAGLGSAELKRELDELGAAGRGISGKPAVQRATQEAVKILNDLCRQQPAR
ncbi:MAG TPA: hypothetical protein VMT16_04490 [Thermoanaerobaculia bacterium]|nr:hypothetical protein [Thermoanaerobaculia bacterium]